MTPRAFCQSGTAERAKGGVHALACALLGVMSLYNLAAYAFRHEPRLLGLGVGYGVGCWFEVEKVCHHWRPES